MVIAALLNNQEHKLNMRTDRGQRVARMAVMMAMVMIMVMVVVVMMVTVVTAMVTMMVLMVVITRMTVNRCIRPCRFLLNRTGRQRGVGNHHSWARRFAL